MRRLAVCLSLALLAACASAPEPTPPSAYRVAMPPPCTWDGSQNNAPCTDTSGGDAPDDSDGASYGSSAPIYAPITIAAPLAPVAPPTQPSHPLRPPAKPKPVNPHAVRSRCPKGGKVCP